MNLSVLSFDVPIHSLKCLFQNILFIVFCLIIVLMCTSMISSCLFFYRYFFLFHICLSIHFFRKYFQLLFYLISTRILSCLSCVNLNLDLYWQLSCLTTVTVAIFQTEWKSHWGIRPTILAFMHSHFFSSTYAALYIQ